MAISSRPQYLKAFSDALHQGHGAFLVWAEISVAAGYPRAVQTLLIAAGQ